MAFFARTKIRLLERMLAGEGLRGPQAQGGRDVRILDVGAGPGVFSVPLGPTFGKVTAVDCDLEMLSRNPVRNRACADVLRLPFADGTFDVVFAGNLLHHVGDPVAALRECARVLRGEHGVLLSVEPNALHPLMYLFGLLVKHERGTIRFTPRYLSGLVRKAGLTLRRRIVSGQVFQNTTPAWMLPLVRPFEERHCLWGGYQHSVLSRAEGSASP